MTDHPDHHAHHEHHEHDHRGHRSAERHGHVHRPAGHRAFVAALAITALYAAVELAGGLWFGSLALVSDAGHMFSDALALGLAAGASVLARRPAGYRHTYGWGRAEVIGALLNGLLMLAIVIWLVVEAVQRLLHPEPVQGLGVFFIAAIGLVINALLAYIVGHGEEGLNRRAALLHVIGDLVSSIAALLAGAVIYFTGWLLVDPILSLVIASLILISTLHLLRETLHVLMEGVPAVMNLGDIGTDLARVPGVARVHDLHVWSIASARIALSAHLEIGSLEEWPRILREAGQLLHDRYGIDHVTLQPEEHRPHGHRATVTLWPTRRKR
jgi:cobalt-zinc-cadmium efflux system protein